MSKVSANGIEIEVEMAGPEDGAPVLLIMGLGAQLTLWPEGFVRRLADAGHRVIRFDNRDVGLSTKLDHAGLPDFVALMASLRGGRPTPVPYLLDDMAADAVGVLDALGIARAHVVGLSMGGMIAQIVAARHADRTRSLTAIMTTTGRAGLPEGSPEARAALLAVPSGNDRASLIAHGKMVRRALQSPAWPMEDAALETFVAAQIDRSFHPEGAARQYAAIMASGDRVGLLPQVKAPTLVLHGEADPILPLAHGHDIASLVHGARMRSYAGWGHDLPASLVPELTGQLADHFARA